MLRRSVTAIVALAVLAIGIGAVARRRVLDIQTDGWLWRAWLSAPKNRDRSEQANTNKEDTNQHLSPQLHGRRVAKVQVGYEGNIDSLSVSNVRILRHHVKQFAVKRCDEPLNGSARRRLFEPRDLWSAHAGVTAL